MLALASGAAGVTWQWRRAEANLQDALLRSARPMSGLLVIHNGSCAV
jgi:hypothetical protein